MTADYASGPIHYGKVIGKLRGDKMEMPYHCMTTEGELKVGQAKATISLCSDNKLQLDLDWQWLGDHMGNGISSYLELD